jgi:hypothetical protein
MIAANAAELSQSHRARRLTAEIAAHGDALRIDRPRELTAVSSAAIVGKRSDELAAGSDKCLQRRVCTRARRLNSQSAVAAVVFGPRDRNRVGAARRGIDSQSSRARRAVERRGDDGSCRCGYLRGADAESPRLRASWNGDAGRHGGRGVVACNCNRCRCLRDCG